MNGLVYITSSTRRESASRFVKTSGVGEAGGVARADRAPRYHARERFIYLAVNATRDVVKVGSSCNPKNRTVHMFLGASLLPTNGVSPRRRWRFRLAHSWSLGSVTYTQAIAVEYAVHRMLRGLASQYITEWYQLDADRAAAAIDYFLARRTA